ncbi:sensor histidine kinase [Mongoliitalea lutea]|uniref:Sensor histidine kinase n=2 Tax=Mongoliitalea lutea TaxID=849756 RepID=A0A8J3D4H0_9BACT|nr:sensor histidine kinase [Mongoliitalea lutea]
MFSQDSLLRVLENSPNNLEVISRLAQSYEHSNSEKARYYADLLLKKSKSSDYDYKSRAYNTLANCYLLESDFFKAEESYLKAIEFSKKGGLKKNEGVYISSLAQINLNQGNIKEAINLYKSSLEILSELDDDNLDFFFSSIYGGLGDCYNQMGVYNEALEYLFESLNINERNGDHISTAISYNSIASVYDNLEQLEKSILYNKKSLEEIRKADYLIAEATILLNLAENFFKVDSIEAASSFLDQSFTMLNDNGLTFNLGNVYQLYGKISLKQDELEKAKDFFVKALELHEADGKNYYLFQTQFNLGEVEVLLGNYEKGKEWILDAIDSFSKNGFLRDKRNALGVLLDYMVAQDDFIDIKNTLTQYRSSVNEYLNEERQNAIIASEIKFEIAQKEAQIETQELQLEAEKVKRNWTLFGLIAVMISASGGLFFYSSKQKEKEKQLAFELSNLHNSINEMELQTLNQQLDPHELSNFIQSVSRNVLRKDEKLYNQLINLWDVTTIVLNHKEFTSDVNTEIENLKKYLIYQQEIVYPKFEFEISNQLTSDDFLVPRLLLRNLAANAIKHGLKGIEGKIEIRLFEESEYIHIWVKDNGRGLMNGSFYSGIGTGTYQTIFNKLNLKNKDKARIEIDTNTPNGVLVKVFIPKNYNYS